MNNTHQTPSFLPLRVVASCLLSLVLLAVLWPSGHTGMPPASAAPGDPAETSQAPFPIATSETPSPSDAGLSQLNNLVEDVDGSCLVDLVDVRLTADEWHQSVTAQTEHLDINNDQAIDIQDVGGVSSKIGETCDSPPWLAYLNTFRAMAGVPPVMENPDWSDGAWLHSRYMVKNDVITHDEDPAKPWFTPEGQEAGWYGNVTVSSSTSTSDEMAISRWMTGPFHQVGIIDPRLRETGFGSYREEIGTWKMGATLDVIRGRGSLPGGVTFPLMFPTDGSTMLLTTYGGGEWPNPLSACPGYTAPTGPPIVLQLADVPSVVTHSFSRNGTSLASCQFDEGSYTNSDITAQDVGRGTLAMRHAVVVMPREPLTSGTYTVSITTTDSTYTWSFSVDTSTPPELPAGDVIMRLPYLARNYDPGP